MHLVIELGLLLTFLLSGQNHRINQPYSYLYFMLELDRLVVGSEDWNFPMDSRITARTDEIRSDYDKGVNIYNLD